MADMKFKCSMCENGRVVHDEDDRRVWDTCYHCAGTGFVDEETHFKDRVAVVAAVLASASVRAERKAMNEDPEGEGWDFRAAEHGMRGGDYARERTMDLLCGFEAELEGLSPRLRAALVEVLVPTRTEANTVIASRPASMTEPALIGQVSTLPAPDAAAEDDNIPF